MFGGHTISGTHRLNSGAPTAIQTQQLACPGGRRAVGLALSHLWLQWRLGVVLGVLWDCPVLSIAPFLLSVGHMGVAHALVAWQCWCAWAAVNGAV